MMTGVDFQVLDANLIRFGGGSAQKRADSCEQFGKSERLYHIIVGAQLKSFYPIANAVSGSEENDRGLDAGFTQFPDQGPAVHFRQHNINDQKIEFAGPGRCQCRDPVARDLDTKPGFAQALTQEGGGFLLIFNNEDLHTPIVYTKRPLPRKRPFESRVGLRQRCSGLGFHQGYIDRIDETIDVHVFPEVGAGNSVTGLRFGLADIHRVAEFVGVGVADEDGHRY